MTTGLARAAAGAAAMAAADGHGCVLVRSRRCAAAAGTRTDGPVLIRRLDEDTERTSAALVLVEPARPDEPRFRYAAAAGCGTRAVQHAARLTVERSGGRWQGPENSAGNTEHTADDDDELVEPPLLDPPHLPDLDPGRLIGDLVGRLPRGGTLEVSAEAHTAVENRLFVPADGPPVRETLRTGAVVVDLLEAGVRVAEADLAWSGGVRPDLGALAARLEQALLRAAAPYRPVPAQVRLLLVDGSAGAFLHEVCGHLLESTRQRPSLLAGHRDRQVAHDRLSVDDDPRYSGSFGAHLHTVLGAPTQRRPLLTAGRLTGLLEDTHDGPWRSEDARHVPQPRMSHLVLAPAASPALLDDALGTADAPVVRVHRLGFGSLDHGDGTVVLEVKDACLDEGSAPRRLEPFLVTAEARRLLMGIGAVGCAATVDDWSAYCLATSGSLPVGASTPALLTGPLTTLPHRRVAPPRAAVPAVRRG